MNRSHDTDPDDVDATFAAIVADLRAEGVGTAETTGLEPDPEPRPKDSKDSKDAPETGGAVTSGTAWRGGEVEWDETMFGEDAGDDDEHYVPPEPPPLPRPRKGAFVVLLFFVVGLLLLIAPNLVGIGTNLGTPLGILSLAIGIALLLLRVKQGPPDGADPTTGAQV
ncbi:hypothetical protein [Amycolatopsis anabasis]|uniref:hypothetical protein n=1 Tax=Amycolatopsis anabasis TaxID=1840409 RepID=UPI00131C492D|nr:hypothetical protein [Amycolatopsis anabasis]